ncbi:BRO family protein [Elizabethkingia anophelis]|uniref:BRO family protein n=1 Tax=Elizabethkingia anophelis TaxID=1117645 RepID=UPI0021A88CF3|nr:damage-inducible protein [Elizabethkingia anophelis]
MEEIVDTGNNELTFEDFKQENGITYWWASDLMKMLGYTDLKVFIDKPVQKATKVLMSLGITHFNEIKHEMRDVNGESVQDAKMTRFACYLTAMNSDVKKPEVAIAQAYFASQTQKFELLVASGDQFERLLTREELAEGQKSLASVAKNAGVEDFAKFQNAGYLGMYNMPSWKLEKKRGVAKGKLFDYMGRSELAANLFRVTQTEERIKYKGIKGQNNIEQAHHEVGKEVREIIVKNIGKTPENLIQEQPLPQVKKELKQGHKKMIQEDKPKKGKNK